MSGKSPQNILSTDPRAYTNSLEGLETCIASVFGTQFLRSLTAFEWTLRLSEDEQERKVSGYISKIGEKSDRSRQFVYVNRRPLDLVRLAKTINEVWRQLTQVKTATPAFVIDFSLPSEDLDLNVTPDKRTIFLRYVRARVYC